MKKKSIICIIFISLFVPIHCHIAEAVNNQLSQSSLTELLNAVSGDWYNEKGNKVLSIQNGCRVVAGFDWAGSSVFGGAVLRIVEDTGLRDLYIDWSKFEGTGNFVQLNQGEHLHAVANGYFFESVCGIHLGMPIDAVESQHGKAQIIPPGKDFIDGNPNRIRWYYPKLGVVLWLDGKSVSRISLLKNSNLRFEWSGLSCQNTPQEFAKAYSMSRVPDVSKKNSDDMAYSIGHGENLYFGHDMSYVGLDIYEW